MKRIEGQLLEYVSRGYVVSFMQNENLKDQFTQLEQQLTQQKSAVRTAVISCL